ncbi:MAG: AI-2E family transporter [Acidimicrobiales bacterium]
MTLETAEDQDRAPDPGPAAAALEGGAGLPEMEARAALEAGVSEEHEYGRLGRPISRDSPFYIGLVGALGVATAFLLVWAVFSARQVLLLLGLSFFIAVGLDPAVRWLQRRGLARSVAVLVVTLSAFALFAGFLALAVPVLVTQATQLAHHLPHYLKSLNNRNSFLGGINTRFHVESRLQKLIGGGSSSSVVGGIVGVGRVVIGVVTGTVIVVVVSIYVLADLPRVKRGLYRLVPRSRRARAVVLADEVFDRVGGYVLGNLLISVISGLGTWIWAEIFGIPYPLLLGLLVALFDLVPIVGSTVGGLVVALVALTVSLPVAIGTAAFYLLYRLLEDYLLTPRIMGRTVKVPGLVTVVAVVLGGALLGIIGAIVAIPVAAAIKLVVDEVSVPRLDRS